jgi:hypothetical protein
MCKDGWGTLEEIAAHGWASSRPNWENFTRGAHTWFALTDSSWDPAGGDDWNDGTKPYGKTLTSLYLIVYGIGNDFVAWHTKEDYLACTLAPKNEYHDLFYLRFIEYDGPAEATAHHGGIGTDTTDLHCTLFDVGNKLSNLPSHRAGVLVHEAWHHWQTKHGFDSSHPSGCTGDECDYFYRHGYSWSHHETLDYYQIAPELWFHSPIQIEAEFFGDLAVYPTAGLPNVIAKTAKLHANMLLQDYFVNKTPYRVGQPRPFW